MNVAHWSRGNPHGAQRLHGFLGRHAFVDDAVQERERRRAHVELAVHEHLAVAGAVHDGAEQLEVLVRRLLPAHGDVDVRRAVLGDELAFVGTAP